jgi:uncharacterized protein
MLDRDAIARISSRYRVRRLAVFGSALTDEFRPDSDVDLLVEFEHGVPVGYFTLAGLELELAEAIGRRVDLRTPAELSPRFRQQVLDAAEPLYG